MHYDGQSFVALDIANKFIIIISSYHSLHVAVKYT